MTTPPPVAILSRSENIEHLVRALRSIPPVTDTAVIGVPADQFEVIRAALPQIDGLKWTLWRGHGIRGARSFVERVADEFGWACWMADDETMVTEPGATIRLSLIAETVTREVGPVPILIPCRCPNLSVCLMPRMIPALFRYPEWVRQSLQVTGPVHPFGAYPAAAGIGIIPGPPIPLNGRPFRLNIGSGPRVFPNWVSMDHDPANMPNIFWKVGGPLDMPVEAGIVEAIYCSHMIDHLDWRSGRHFLTDCIRVLKPGAPIRITACNARVFARKYLDGTIGDMAYFQPEEFSRARTAGSKFGIVACGAMSDRSWYAGHRQFFDGPALCEALEDAGFTDVRECQENEVYDPAFEDVDDIFPDHTVYAAARKPA